MADDFKLTDVHGKGLELGARLREGDADGVQREHDALINRVHDELKDKPQLAKDVVNHFHYEMSQTAPEDVASPGHGTKEGYYVYFGPERSVNRTLKTLDDFCNAHSRCQGMGPFRNPYSQYATLEEKANNSPAVQKELSKLLTDVNNSLFYDPELPTGLEAEVFTNDFNRRNPYAMFRARKTETFRSEIFRVPPDS